MLGNKSFCFLPLSFVFYFLSLQGPQVVCMERVRSPTELFHESFSVEEETGTEGREVLFRGSGIPHGQGMGMGKAGLSNYSGFGIPSDQDHTNRSRSIRHYDFIIEYPDYSQVETVRGIFISLFVAECVIGVLGNFFVCLTVYRNKNMHSPVNYYIVNLGICDFLVGAVVLPVKLFELTADAEMNTMTDFWCTIVRYLETMVVFASAFTLVAICFERYNAVVYPVQSRINMTNLRIRRVLALVWIVPGLLAAPNLYPASSASQLLYSNYGEFSRVTCFDGFSDTFRFWYFMFLFLFMYLLPLCFIGVTCTSIARVLLKEIPVQPRRDPRALSLERGRRKVAKMVLVVVVAFFVCWTPYFLVTVVTQLQSVNFMRNGQYFFTMLLINLLAFTNSCVNPFVYFAMSARFRKGFLCILRSFRNCSRRNRFSPENSNSSTRRTSHNRTINGVLSLNTHPTSRRNLSSYRGGGGEAFTLRRTGNAGCSGGSPRNAREKTPPIPLNSGNQGGSIQICTNHGNGSDRHLPPGSRTILLQINHCKSPSCCRHLVPLITNGDGILSTLRDGQGRFQDRSPFPWDESCEL